MRKKKGSVIKDGDRQRALIHLPSAQMILEISIVS